MFGPVRPHLNKLLVKQEGISLVPYLDTEGYHTIGVGHKIEKITRQEALNMLETDILKAVNLAKKLTWFHDLSSIRQEVIINMVFNMGLRGVKGFKKMIFAIKHEYFLNASVEMLDSKWADQVGGRAGLLARMMLNDKRY